MSEAYRRGIRHSFWGSAGVAVLQFLQMLVFMRWVGPTAAGDFALAAAFYGFLAPLAEAGIGQAVVQEKSIRGVQLATLAWVSLGLELLLLAFVWLLGPSIANWYGRPELTGLIAIMLLGNLLTPFGTSLSGLIVRDLRFDLIARIEVSSFAIGFVSLTILLLLNWGVYAMAVSFTLRNAFAGLACFWAMRRRFPVQWLKPGRLSEVWPLLRFGALDLSARWADYLANYLDKLIIGKWLGATALGYYQLAFNLSIIPTARLGYVIARVSFPLFAKFRSDIQRLQESFQRAAKDVVLILFPIYIGMALFANEIVFLLYGPDWMPAGPLLMILSIGGLVRSMNGVFPQLTKGIGKPELSTGWMLLWALALGVSLVSFLSFLPIVQAAAWSRIAAKFTIEIGLLFWLARWCNVKFKPIFKYASGILAGCLPIVVLVWSVSKITPDFWLALIFKLTVFLIGLVVLAKFSPWKSDFYVVWQAIFHKKTQQSLS